MTPRMPDDDLAVKGCPLRNDTAARATLGGDAVAPTTPDPRDALLLALEASRKDMADVSTWDLVARLNDKRTEAVNALVANRVDIESMRAQMLIAKEREEWATSACERFHAELAPLRRVVEAARGYMAAREAHDQTKSLYAGAAEVVQGNAWDRVNETGLALTRSLDAIAPKPAAEKPQCSECHCGSLAPVCACRCHRAAEKPPLAPSACRVCGASPGTQHTTECACYPYHVRSFASEAPASAARNRSASNEDAHSSRAEAPKSPAPLGVAPVGDPCPPFVLPRVLGSDFAAWFKTQGRDIKTCESLIAIEAEINRLRGDIADARAAAIEATTALANAGNALADLREAVERVRADALAATLGLLRRVEELEKRR